MKLSLNGLVIIWVFSFNNENFRSSPFYHIPSFDDILFCLKTVNIQNW